MQVLIMGGFLGSGKTSIIRSLIRGLANAGYTCAIIENEIGEVGIDDALFGEAELSVTPLFGGCVCCQISGSLVSAAQRIQNEIAPEWLIVEMTGLALMDNIRDVFVSYGHSDVRVHTVSVVDMSRWEHLMGALAMIFNGQVAGADVVLLNKTDVEQPTEETYEIVNDKAPGAIIMQLDGATKEPDALWEGLMNSLKEHASLEEYAKGSEA